MALIVLEGLDGAGKSTQIEKLRNMASERGIESEYVHFPRFDAPIFGELIARFLRGELGALDSVNPYLVALIYAEDRAQAAPMIHDWMAQGKLVIVDRYVYSNIGYQCAKMPSERRGELRDWILGLEYGYMQLPKPDINIFLDVPFAFTEHKLTAVRKGDDREYLGGASDIHESSLDLQRNVREVYLDSAQLDSNLVVVDCSTEQGAMASPDEIFSRLSRHIKHLL